MTTALTEKTRVKVTLGTAWTIIASIVASAVWLTTVAMRTQVENQREHATMMEGINRINEQSEDWITKQQFEDALAFLIAEAHRGMTNITIREHELRQGLRDRITSPKNTP